MNASLLQAFGRNFLGRSPVWYKQTILAFLVLNPIALLVAGPVAAGWLLIFEFIFTLAMALKCYPLQPGGLLAMEAVIIGLTSAQAVYDEIKGNLEVILLLIFMVAGIYFMKKMLLWLFTGVLLKVRSKIALSLMFCLMAAFLSAFLDALTVTAVLISVCVGFYGVYHQVASGKQIGEVNHDQTNDDGIAAEQRADLEEFRAFLRSLLMHGAVGTALGGVCTLVGEPQNLLIAEKSGWSFIEFVKLMSPFTVPVLFMGLLTCAFVEWRGWFGYGGKLPESVRRILQASADDNARNTSIRDRAGILVQIAVACLLIAALATHVAAVGLIGLGVIILLTTFNGVTEEHQIGHAFEESLPFTALLVVFFTIVAIIHDQQLFHPIIHGVLDMPVKDQPVIFFIANGVLSSISDNVFVASVYINEVLEAWHLGVITRDHYDNLAIAINLGTNLPSVATPNGQAAFLFLLTSAIAPLIRLSYGRMVWMALPYTIVMSATSLALVAAMLN